MSNSLIAPVMLDPFDSPTAPIVQDDGLPVHTAPGFALPATSTYEPVVVQ